MIKDWENKILTVHPDRMWGKYMTAKTIRILIYNLILWGITAAGLIYVLNSMGNKIKWHY